MEKIRRKEKRSDEFEFREFRNDKTRKDGGEEMRRAWKKRWIPTCPSCWLTGYGLFFFFFWHLQLDHVKVRASLLALRPDADPQWQQERPRGEARRSRSREEVLAPQQIQTHLTHLWIIQLLTCGGRPARPHLADGLTTQQLSEEERRRRKHVLLRVKICHLSHPCRPEKREF